jgi:hypothetical protein
LITGANWCHAGVARHEVREFNPDRKDHHWGRRKLKRDQRIRLRAPTGYGNIRHLVEMGLKVKSK